MLVSINNAKTRNKKQSMNNLVSTDRIEVSQFNLSLFNSDMQNNINKKKKKEEVNPKTIDVTEYDYHKLLQFSDKMEKKKQIYTRLINNKGFRDSVRDYDNSHSNSNYHSKSPRSLLTRHTDKKINVKSVSIMTNSFLSSLNDENKSKKKLSTMKYRMDETPAEEKFGEKVNFSSAYFRNILQEYKEKTHKVSIKGLDPNMGKLEKLLYPDNMDPNHPRKKGKPVFFLTNEPSNLSSSPIRKRNKKQTVKKAQLNLLFKNYVNNDNVSTQFKNQSSTIDLPTSKKSPTILTEINKNIVHHNNSIKVLCYNSPTNAELTVKDLITEDIAKDYTKMTVNKSKCKMMEADTSYIRFKGLDSKLPLLITARNTLGKVAQKKNNN